MRFFINAAPEVVKKMTTSYAASDNNFVSVVVFPFHGIGQRCSPDNYHHVDMPSFPRRGLWYIVKSLAS